MAGGSFVGTDGGSPISREYREWNAHDVNGDTTTNGTRFLSNIERRAELPTNRIDEPFRIANNYVPASFYYEFRSNIDNIQSDCPVSRMFCSPPNAGPEFRRPTCVPTIRPDGFSCSLRCPPRTFARARTNRRDKITRPRLRHYFYRDDVRDPRARFAFVKTVRRRTIANNILHSGYNTRVYVINVGRIS